MGIVLPVSHCVGACWRAVVGVFGFCGIARPSPIEEGLVIMITTCGRVLQSSCLGAFSSRIVGGCFSLVFT